MVAYCRNYWEGSGYQPHTDAPQSEDVTMLRREGYLRVKEAAKLLGVAPNTLRAWGADGKVPEYRHPVNRYRLYRRDDLEQVLQQLDESVNASTEAASRKRRE